MGKVLIVSDTHGWRYELEVLKDRYKHEVDLMIHCGDSELTNEDAEIEGFKVVRGNCDFEESFHNEEIIGYGNIRFFVTHGHLHSVKSSMMRLLYRAEEVNAQIVCYGHTHVLGAEMVKDKLFINPGSLRLPRERAEKTYVLLEIHGEQIELQVFDFDKGELVDLRRIFQLSS